MNSPPVSANEFLAIWQAQHRAGIKPADRRLPVNDNVDAFERDLDVLRKLLERA